MQASSLCSNPGPCAGAANKERAASKQTSFPIWIPRPHSVFLVFSTFHITVVSYICKLAIDSTWMVTYPVRREHPPNSKPFNSRKRSKFWMEKYKPIILWNTYVSGKWAGLWPHDSPVNPSLIEGDHWEIILSINIIKWVNSCLAKSEGAGWPKPKRIRFYILTHGIFQSSDYDHVTSHIESIQTHDQDTLHHYIVAKASLSKVHWQAAFTYQMVWNSSVQFIFAAESPQRIIHGVYQRSSLLWKPRSWSWGEPFPRRMASWRLTWNQGPNHAIQYRFMVSSNIKRYPERSITPRQISLSSTSIESSLEPIPAFGDLIYGIDLGNGIPARTLGKSQVLVQRFRGQKSSGWGQPRFERGTCCIRFHANPKQQSYHLDH